MWYNNSISGVYFIFPEGLVLKDRLPVNNTGVWLRRYLMIGGVLLNVLLAFIEHLLDLPLYLDTVGTVVVAALGGLYPGIVTAVCTNALCLFFNPDAPYFVLVNIIIAIYTAWFVRKYSLKKIVRVTVFIIGIAIISALSIGLIQWFFVGKTDYPIVLETVSAITDSSGMSEFFAFIFVLMILNIIDKGFSIGIAVLVMHFIPEGKKKEIYDGGWKQKPLTAKEIKANNKLRRKVSFSLRTRIVLILLVVSIGLSLIIGWVGMRLYYNKEKEEKTQNAINAAKFAAEMIDGDRVGEYLEKGFDAEGYEETRDMLYRIRENASGVHYLYVVKIKEDGCHFVFDLDTDDSTAIEPGTVYEFEEAFLPYLPALFAGETIEPIESYDISGWVMTVYYPVYNSGGKCVCYACADVSLQYMAGYVRAYVIRALLILSGFMILVLAYGLWTSEMNIVYPITSIASCANSLFFSDSDQESLDENVRKLRSLDIRTGDETEILYQSICNLALGMAEQTRDVRRFAEGTAKMQSGLIITMADMVENRDSDTGAHVQKTAAYVKIILEGLERKGYYTEKLTPKFMSDTVMSAPLHDVGKINIPDAVLNKPGKLDDKEYEIMKTHTTAGKKILENAISTVQGENYLKEARNMAAYHHERWDGKGYPEGLHGEVIPLSARIMAVADVFDALTSPRVYKPAFPLQKALDILQDGAGKAFDPKCVEVFMDSLPEVKAILKKYNPDVPTSE